MCAHHAIPLPKTGPNSSRIPDDTCDKNHMPRKKIAGISIKRGINPSGISVTILESGNIKKYAPITPEIAPDAPTVGMGEFALKNQWVKAAAKPLKM